MKTQITFFLIFVCGLAFAQVPDYLSNDPKWRQEAVIGSSMPCLMVHNYIYYLNGDSVIGDLEYKKLFEVREIEYRWMAPPPHDNCDGTILISELRALLRQEGKMIYLNVNGADHLLYNFDLAVGDTLPLTWNMMTEGIYVTGIDSIFIGDHYRKVFYLDEVFGMDSFIIEGIGSNYGLLEDYPQPFLNYPSNLVCFTLNDTTYFPGFGEDCDLTVNTPLVKKDFNLRVSPNPVKDRLRIDHNMTSEIEQILVYDYYGRRLFVEPKTITSLSLELDLSFLSHGFYILELQTTTSRTRIKVMKQ